MVSSISDPFWDWKITGLFYSAVHYIQTYFEAKKVTLPPVMQHKKRLTLVKWHLPTIYKAFEDLYNDSRDARYEADITFTEKDVLELEKKLQAVKAAITPHI